MKNRRILKNITIFFVMSLSAFAVQNSKNPDSSGNRLNSTAEKIREIRIQKEELNLKIKELEELEKKFIESEKVKKPKIGLVLSGGGAKGVAHIGVLKVLEKYQIPIDYIVGTSAGSIVAAMYSVGYTPDEIEKTLTGLHYYSLFTNAANRRYESVDEKVSSIKYPINLSWTKDFDLSLPAGMFSGEPIYLELKGIFARAENIKSFDDFPIPFRAMTTNLQTGESVVLNSGDLALSTLKSMAIPTFLDPIMDDGNYYVDGGLSDNFPVLQAINMGADIVIGVDIGAEPFIINENSNVLEVMDKLSAYNTEKSTKISAHYPDILITPNVLDHGMMDFNELSYLVKAGEDAAEEMSSALVKLTNEEQFNEIRHKKKQMKNKKIDIKNIEVKGNSLLTMDEIEKLKPTDGSMGVAELNLWAEKIYAKNFIDRVFYSVDGETVDFTVREKIDTKLRAGVFYVSNYGAGLNLVADIPVFDKYYSSQKNYIVKTELSNYPKILITDRSSYNIWSRKLIVSGNLEYGFNPIFLYNAGNNISTYENQTFKSSLSLGTTIFERIIFDYTFSFKMMNTKYSSGEKIKDFSNFKKDGPYFVNTFSLYYDTMNKAEYATSGSSALLQSFYETNASTTSTSQGYSGILTKYLKLSDSWSMNATISGGKIYNTANMPLSDMFNFGGIRDDVKERTFSFYGLPISSVYTDYFYSGKVGLQYSFFQDLHLNFVYNIGTSSYYSGFETKKNVWDMKKHGYGVGLGWDTFLGPIDFVLSNDIFHGGVLCQVHIGYVF